MAPGMHHWLTGDLIETDTFSVGGELIDGFGRNRSRYCEVVEALHVDILRMHIL